MKKLIVCADGTWNTETETDHGLPCPTNVTKLARALYPSDQQGIPQVVFYHSGVGTNFGQRVSGGAFGAGLFENVVDCYRFLILNYEPGDLLYFFGFSRGAFTVRSLAGLVRNSGILKRGEEAYEREAIDLYRDDSPATAPNAEASKQFRAAHSHEPDIEFIGVWDTVGALGIPGMGEHFRLPGGVDWQFHDVTLSSKTHHAFHALAIHEHRSEFLPTLWEKPLDDPAGQVLEQVWFTGAHSDVGGGYPSSGLSDVALHWMIEKARDAGGLKIGNPPYRGFEPNPLGAGHNSFSAFYQVLDFLERKMGGSLRVYNEKPELTCQSLHPSVVARFKDKTINEKWPPTFLQALQKL